MLSNRHSNTFQGDLCSARRSVGGKSKVVFTGPLYNALQGMVSTTTPVKKCSGYRGTPFQAIPGHAIDNRNLFIIASDKERPARP